MERDSDLASEGATPPTFPLHSTELVRFSNLCLFFFFFGGVGPGGWNIIALQCCVSFSVQ